MGDHRYCVYLLTSGPRGVLYVGVTNNLARRVEEHRQGKVPGFTRNYQVKTLVWFEEHGDIHAAIAREKRLKRWRRAWKIALVEERNPGWVDLFTAVAG